MRMHLFYSSFLMILFGLFNHKALADDRPNIVWLLSEDNSKHYLKMFDEHGIETPNIEKLADSGLKFIHAFSNSPVCSTARTTLITGCYGPRIGTQFHRKSQAVPLPDDLKMFPAYLRAAGFYTTNNHKEDYNAIKAADVWDESSENAHWRNRKAGQPFFHQQNVGNTHESQLHFSKEKMQNYQLKTDTASVFVFPNHPDTELFRFTNAYYRDRILSADEGVAEVVKQLEEDGLLENTFVFYFGDHGGVLPGSKGYLYETGLNVPLVVRIPEKFRHLVAAKSGKSITGFVSFVDFAPTVLNLCGIKVPEEMDGKPFMGKEISEKEMNKAVVAFGYADRFDEKYDLVRSCRKGNYKYIRNYQPFNPPGLYNDYRYKMLAYQEWRDLWAKDKLNKDQSKFFLPQQPEELYDIEKDPYELNNLAKDPAFSKTLADMRGLLIGWVKENNDLSFYPESVLRHEAFKNPVAFGRKNSQHISRLVDIADLALLPFVQAQNKIKIALNSPDPWARYWGLIVCSSFGKQALVFADQAKEIAKNDKNLLVRTRAAEFLALEGIQNPQPIIEEVLTKTIDDVEATLILNTVVLLMDSPKNYSFHIYNEMFDPKVLIGEYVQRRLEYIYDKQN